MDASGLRTTPITNGVTNFQRPVLDHLLHGDYPAIKYVTAAFEKNLVLKPDGADLNLLPRSAADVE
jgi:hypothetical protein